MTTTRAVEDHLRLLVDESNTQPIREQSHRAVTDALADLFEHLGQDAEQIDFLYSFDPNQSDDSVAEDIVRIQGQVSEQYATSLSAHLVAKKAWALAMNRVYQAQASEKATEKQVNAAIEAEQEARIPFDETLEKFMNARRAEESFRQVMYAYQAQTLEAARWLAVHILRVHSYTPGASHLTERLLRELPALV